MTRFRYKAISEGGDVRRGELDAASRQAAVDQIRTAGYLPIRADEIPDAGYFPLERIQHFLRKDRVTSRDVLHFTRELATLVRVGMPLDGSLQMLAGATGPGAMRDLIDVLRTRIQGGAAFSVALAETEGAFSPLYVSMIRAGEAGGALGTVIERLAEYLERTAKLRASVINALIYPVILVVVAVLSLCLLMTFVVPQFIPLFRDAGATLPVLTQVVFKIAGVFRDYWWLMLFGVAAVAFIVDRRLKVPATRRAWDAWCLRAPLIGGILQGVETARFATTLSTLLANGVPLLGGIRLVREVIGNRIIASDIDAVDASLESGGTLVGPLKESGTLPRLAVQLMEVGEESGQLEEMLGKVGDIYDDDVQTKLKRMLTIAEPLLILGLGGIIAVIIMSILVAILGLDQLVT